MLGATVASGLLLLNQQDDKGAGPSTQIEPFVERNGDQVSVRLAVRNRRHDLNIKRLEVAVGWRTECFAISQRLRNEHFSPSASLELLKEPVKVPTPLRKTFSCRIPLSEPLCADRFDRHDSGASWDNKFNAVRIYLEAQEPNLSACAIVELLQPDNFRLYGAPHFGEV